MSASALGAGIVAIDMLSIVGYANPNEKGSESVMLVMAAPVE